MGGRVEMGKINCPWCGATVDPDTATEADTEEDDRKESERGDL